MLMLRNRRSVRRRTRRPRCHGGNLKKMASVASFFISRIDSLIDSIINDKLKTTTDAGQQALLKACLKVAIANGKLTYQSYERIFSGPRWQASPPRARRRSVFCGPAQHEESAYRDVIYVEELMARTRSTLCRPRPSTHSATMANCAMPSPRT